MLGQDVQCFNMHLPFSSQDSLVEINGCHLPARVAKVIDAYFGSNQVQEHVEPDPASPIEWSRYLSGSITVSGLASHVTRQCGRVVHRWVEEAGLEYGSYRSFFEMLTDIREWGIWTLARRRCVMISYPLVAMASRLSAECELTEDGGRI